tara:strand:- start:1669 stop:2016 length:348 start_codon:yes stop_codon:yes gene_type:complete
MIFTNRGSKTSLLFGKSKKKKRAKRHAHFMRYRTELGSRMTHDFTMKLEARRLAMMPFKARYDEARSKLDSSTFNVERRQLAADRMAEDMLTQSRVAGRNTKKTIGMVRIPRRKM